VSIITWFLVAYLAIGMYIMTPGIVNIFKESDEVPIAIKISASIVSIIVWPLIFTM
jgi:hypothetical protein